MEYDLRWYQEESVECGLAAIEQGYNPVIVLPTGAGKTLTLSGLVERFLEENPRRRILVLSHVKEILEQNYNTLTHFVGPFVGVYSAGLGRRQLNQPIIVAGIQSLYKLVDEHGIFATTGLIIVDECHLVNHRDQGMYRDVLNRCIGAHIVGLTATPFRLGHGYIYQGDDTVFDVLGYTCGTREQYNRLVDEGYLSKIISKRTDYRLDISGVRTTAGDYNQKDLSDKLDQTAITNTAVKEIVKYGKNYKKWLIFGIDIAHSKHIKGMLEEQGIPTGIVHSQMKEDRAVEIELFKMGKYRALVNVDVLTTGFDEPRIDLIAMLRPTKSPVIHVQTVGRGARVAEGKDHCLFLDFAGNTERLGPINDIKIKKKGDKKGTGEAPVKTCPDCQVIHHPSVRECDVCGHVFEFKTKLTSQSSGADVVAKDKSKPLPKGTKQWVRVDGINYSIHSKPGKSDSLRVMYRSGINSFSEWIAYGRKNYGGQLAKNWVRWRWPSGQDLPKDVGDLYKNKTKLRVPTRVLVDTTEKWPRILDAEF